MAASGPNTTQINALTESFSQVTLSNQTSVNELPKTVEDATHLLNQAKKILLFQLDRTKSKCEKKSLNLSNQERYLHVAEDAVPNLMGNKHKAACAFTELALKIEKMSTLPQLKIFLTELREKKGLFFQMYRGGTNKRLFPKLPAEMQTYKFTY